MIQLLVDENMPTSVIEWLRVRGLTARRVTELGLKGARDEKVAEYAIKNSMIILTLDTDFAQIYHDVFRGLLGIVVVRAKPPTAVNIIEMLDKTLKKITLDDLDKKLTIITERKVRMIVG